VPPTNARPPGIHVVIGIAIGIAVGIACGSAVKRGPAERLMQGVSGADASIEQACELTARRCTACHDIDRVLYANPSEPSHWRNYIGRMRRMRGSGISIQDGDVILRCLVARSFGEAGLRELDDGP